MLANEYDLSFIGQEKNIYKGVIEDNNDPLKIGRVRVRVLGVHSHDKTLVPVDTLPWCSTVESLRFGGFTGGKGISSVPVNGTWVYCISENSDLTRFIILGGIAGVVGDIMEGEIGFKDPNNIYPYKSRLKESDYNRLATNVKVDGADADLTSHKKTNNTIDIVSKTDSVSSADVSQTEPNSTSNLGVYPNVSVIETQSGHTIEVDDTKDNERIKIYHKSGTYLEIKPDGSTVYKSVGLKNNEIKNGDLEEHVKGYIKTYVENNIERIIGGGLKEHINMDLFKHVSGYFKLTADGNLEIVNDVKITGNLEVTQKITATSDITSKAQVADSQGNLSSLRQAFDTHVHLGNLGRPVSLPINTDPKTRTSDFTWSSNPKGFK